MCFNLLTDHVNNVIETKKTKLPSKLYDFLTGVNINSKIHIEN